MQLKSYVARFAGVVSLLTAITLAFPARAQSNFTMRVMAANITSDNQQSYEAEGIRIFQGLKPDVVAIQEFQVGGNSDSNTLRTLVDTAFGTNFSFYCEPNNAIPNGIVSRWPILSAGFWDDPFLTDRDFAWAQIDLPGTNDLYVVSVHLWGNGSDSQRGIEANIIKAHVQTNLPAGAWVIVGGDMNTDARSDTPIDNFKTFLSDSPIPSDEVSTTVAERDKTSRNRSKPYDYVLPGFALTNYLIPVVVGTHTFSNGLVFDSRVYPTLSDVPPVQVGDSGAVNMQHMAVVKDFSIPVGVITNTAPVIVAQPASQTNSFGANATFSVSATGTTPLSYQWRLYSTNIPGATASSYTRTNIQPADAGPYSVVVTNVVGSVTSSNAVLTVEGKPAISSQPQSVTVNAGANATFNVSANGSPTLGYQWRLAGTNIPGATLTSFTRSNAQPADAGSYTVVVTNSEGSVTSAVAVLTVLSGSSSVIAQWNFNSVVPDATTSTGTTTPSVGSGTASAVGGATTSFASGDTVLDPAPAADNSAWNSTTYPAVSADNKSRGLQFAVSTVGWQNIIVYWGSRSSDTGSRYGRMQYSTNGVNFTDFTLSFSNSNTVFTRKTNSLAAVSAVNDNPSFIVRFVSEFESTAINSGTVGYVAANSPTSSYSTGGTMRYDMVTILGSPIVSGTAPVITNQPADAVVNQGADATFTVGADGTSPLSYQWRFNAGDIAGATAASYTRSNVQPSHIGSYSVTVSNASGFTTSSNAALTLNIPSPELSTPAAGVLQWLGLSNLNYTVQTKTNLSQTNWITLGTVSSATANVSFTNQPATDAERYYRVTYP